MSYSDDDPVGFRYPNKFLTCTQPVGATAVGPGTDYPFAMTLEHAMNLYWKIYSFKVSGAYTFTYKYIKANPNEVIEITSTNTALFAGTLSHAYIFEGGWPQKMSEMVCLTGNGIGYGPIFYGFGSVGSGLIQTSEGIYFSIGVTGTLAILFFLPILRTEEEDDFQAKYYIPFQFNAGLDDDYGSGISTNSLGSGGSKIVKQGAFKLKIDGTTYTTSLEVTASYAPSTPFDLNFSGTIEMEAANARLAE